MFLQHLPNILKGKYIQGFSWQLVLCPTYALPLHTRTYVHVRLCACMHTLNCLRIEGTHGNSLCVGMSFPLKQTLFQYFSLIVQWNVTSSNALYLQCILPFLFTFQPLSLHIKAEYVSNWCEELIKSQVHRLRMIILQIHVKAQSRQSASLFIMFSGLSRMFHQCEKYDSDFTDALSGFSTGR